ncbi:MAG: flagellar hook protein FlgE [Burkholderiaceae bacterium]
MSFQNGLSGLNAAAQNLDVIGNNVANVNTVGAKASRAQFADVYANSIYGQGAVASGMGVTVSSVDQQFTQGAISASDNPLDMAINGSGFFRLSRNGAVSYSRNGEFRLDKDSYLVTSDGARLTGYGADANGTVLVGMPQELRLSSANIAPQATTEGEIQMNLDSRIVALTTPFSATDPASYSGATTLSVFDQQGNANQLTTFYRKVGDNSWEVYGAANGSPITGGGPNGSLTTLTFNPDGSLSAPSTPVAITVPTSGSAGGSQTMSLDLTGVTQFGTTFSVTAQTQNGFAPGEIAGFSIAKDGTVMANYTNGETKAQGQVVLANFSNPQGLAPMGGNAWAETADSGQPVVGIPTSGALGALKSGALESSNIDLTEELVNMITAQRSYQANAQTIKTQDQILQTIVNLR